MLKNGQTYVKNLCGVITTRCLKVCLAILQHYERKG